LPVGNDVVDLRDPANQPDAIHPRFDRRVFADVELVALDNLPVDERHLERWMRWAAKEGAFKLTRQVVPHTSFHPRELSVSRITRTSARVTSPALGRDLQIAFDLDEERVHAVVTDRAVGTAGDLTPQQVQSGTRRLVSTDPIDATAEVRRYAAATLARLLRLEPGAVEITASGPGRPPVARSRGEVLPADVSLSHDGRWVAWAVAVR
jgi:phosphopantetheinyl transferase (holo-ACP synthase)